MMPYVGLANGLGYVPNANIPVGRSTIPKPPASPQQESNAAQIAKGLQAMPQGAKNQLTSNVKGLFGPTAQGNADLKKALAQKELGTMPDQISPDLSPAELASSKNWLANKGSGLRDIPLSDTGIALPASSALPPTPDVSAGGGFGDWLSGLFSGGGFGFADGGLAGGYASGGVVPRHHFQQGGDALVSETPAADELRALMAQKEDTVVVPVKTETGVVPVEIPKSEATGVVEPKNRTLGGYKKASEVATGNDVYAQLHPEFAPKFRQFIEEANRQGMPISPGSLYRSPPEQASLKAAKLAGTRGAYQNLPVANPYESPHNYALAGDFAGYKPEYKDRLGKISQNIGLVYGGEFGDPIHVQLGRNFGQLKPHAYDEKGNFNRNFQLPEAFFAGLQNQMSTQTASVPSGGVGNAAPASGGLVVNDPDMPSRKAYNAGFNPPPADWTSKGLGDRLMDTEGAPRSLIERVIGSPLSDEARSGLLAAGLGMMASRGRTAGQQIGEGGLGGLQTYYNALANKQAQAKQEADIGKTTAETEKLKTETGLTLSTKLAEINRVRAIKNLPPINSLEEFQRRSADNTLFAPSPTETPQPKVGQPAKTEQPKVVTGEQPKEGEKAPAPAATAPPAPLTAQTLATVNDPNTQKAFQSIDWANIADTHNIPMMLKQLQEFKAAGDSALTVDEMIKAREEEAKINTNIQNIINSRQLLTKDSQVISPPQWTDTANRLEAAKTAATKGAENIAEADKSYSDASQTRALAYGRIERVGQLLEAYQTGQLSDVKTQVPAIAAALGMKIDESKLNDRAYQEKFVKEATNMMFDQVKQLGGRILVSELESAKMANVNPDLQPASNRQLLATAKGAMDAEKQFYQDYLAWREKNPTPSTTEFQRFKQQWLDDPSHAIGKYVDAAAANMPTRGDLPTDPASRKEGWQYVITADKLKPEVRDAFAQQFPKGAVATWDGKKWINERPVK
jgi:hypothetical protein